MVTGQEYPYIHPWPFTLISIRIYVRMSASNYPCYGQFDEEVCVNNLICLVSSAPTWCLWKVSLESLCVFMSFHLIILEFSTLFRYDDKTKIQIYFCKWFTVSSSRMNIPACKGVWISVAVLNFEGVSKHTVRLCSLLMDVFCGVLNIENYYSL